MLAEIVSMLTTNRFGFVSDFNNLHLNMFLLSVITVMIQRDWRICYSETARTTIRMKRERSGRFISVGSS